MADRIDTLAESVQMLSTSMDRRFDEVRVALVEQREYTELASSRLEAKMDAGFARFDAGFARVDAEFARVDAGFARVDGGFARVDANFARIERKLDQFIDAQLTANQLVDRRLRALEP